MSPPPSLAWGRSNRAAEGEIREGADLLLISVLGSIWRQPLFGSPEKRWIRQVKVAIDNGDIESICHSAEYLLTITSPASGAIAEQVVDLCAVATETFECNGLTATRLLDVAAKYSRQCRGSTTADLGLVYTASKFSHAYLEVKNYEGVRRSWEIADCTSRFFIDQDAACYLSGIASASAIAAVMLREQTWITQSMSFLVNLASKFGHEACVVNDLVEVLSSLDQSPTDLELIADPKYWERLKIDAIPAFAADERCANLLSIAAYFVVNGAFGLATTDFWARQSEKIANLWPDDCGIQGRLGHAATNLMIGHRISEPANHWSRVLTSTAERFPTVPQIQAQAIQGAFNACDAIRGNGFDIASFDERVRPWIDSIISALEASGLDESTIKPFAIYALQRTLIDGSREFARLCLAIHEYWPGFECEFYDQKESIKLGDVIQNCQQFSAFDLNDALNLISQRKRVESEAAGLSHDDPATLRSIWKKRMFLVDRGDSLMVPLRSLNLIEEYAEGCSDPWRLKGKDRWQPRVLSNAKGLG